MAPQILKGEKYNSKCDVWSMGIIIFEVFFYVIQMLYGHFPWHKQMRGPQNANSLLKILTEPLKIPE
jgi:serine/threonine protein kinase